jgi:hypothetical protein
MPLQKKRPNQKRIRNMLSGGTAVTAQQQRLKLKKLNLFQLKLQRKKQNLRRKRNSTNGGMRRKTMPSSPISIPKIELLAPGFIIAN